MIFVHNLVENSMLFTMELIFVSKERLFMSFRNEFLFRMVQVPTDNPVATAAMLEDLTNNAGS